MVKINLLPLKVKKTHVTLRLYTYIVIGSSLIGLVLVLLLINLVSQTNKINDKIKQVEAKRLEITDQVAPINKILIDEKESDKLKRKIYDLALEQSVWIHILDSLARQIGDDMWLTTVASTREKSGNGLLLTIEGQAYHKISIADFLSNLEKSDRFSNVKLEALSDQMDKKIQSVRFKVTMNYAGALQPARQEARHE